MQPPTGPQPPQWQGTEPNPAGTMNTGGMNTGSMNTGSMNTGSMNTGGMNTGSMNTGSMNNDDTGYAPELRGERSANLYRRDTPFWREPPPPPPKQRMPDPWQTMHGRPRDKDYEKHPQQFRKTRSHQPPKGRMQGYGVPVRHSARPGSHVLRWLLGIVLVLAVAGVIGWNFFMDVKHITVEGNTTISTEEIIRLSGLSPGTNRFMVRADEVASRIEQNRYLICELVHLSSWDTVHIRVSERYPVAAVEYSGMVAYTDLRGMVLEREIISPDQKEYEGLIRVNGMLVSYCVPGTVIVPRDKSQLEAYTNIMLELKTLDLLSWIRELNLNSMDSIYLVTTDHYTVHLGNVHQLHEKLRAMQMVVGELRAMQSETGTLDVTAPVTPSFIPDSNLSRPSTMDPWALDF